MVRRFGTEIFPIILSPLYIGVMIFDALSGSRYSRCQMDEESELVCIMKHID